MTAELNSLRVSYLSCVYRKVIQYTVQSAEEFRSGVSGIVLAIEPLAIE